MLATNNTYNYEIKQDSYHYVFQIPLFRYCSKFKLKVDYFFYVEQLKQTDYFHGNGWKELMTL